MDVCLIEVPYMLGGERHAAAEGPRRYLDGGAKEILAARRLAFTVERVERADSGPFADGRAASLAVNEALAPVVREAVDTGRLPPASASAALTTYTPARDRDERTLRAGLRVIDLVAEGA